MRMGLVCAVTAFGMLAASAAIGEDGTLILYGSADYSTGKYGSSERTDISYFPLIAKYERGRFTGKVTVPYLQITGPGNVVGFDGVVVIPLPPGVVLPRKTESGLGDIVATATYTALDDRDSGTLLDLTGKIKFPTADEKKGLGTGETDYAMQVDTYRRFGAVTPFATVGYRILGDPPQVNFRNVWFGSLGGSYRASPETSVGALFDFRQAALRSSYPMRELTAFLVRRIDAGWKVQVYAVKGFSDGSPDWGGGMLISKSL